LRLGGQLKRIGTCVVDEGLRLLLRRRHFLERVVHGGRRIRLLDRHALHLHPGAVIVQQLLHHLRNALLDLASAGADRLVERHAGHDRAHRAFTGFANRLLGILDLEEVELRIADVPTDRISEVDDVLIPGEDQILAAAVGTADVDRADFLHVHLLHAIDWRRQAEADARLERTGIFAERVMTPASCGPILWTLVKASQSRIAIPRP
jgi:hypothetical protein